MAREEQKQLTWYRPNQRHDLGLVRTWGVMAGSVVRSRDLIWQLFRRDFVGAYKKSFLGLTWVFLAPLLGIVSWVFLKGTGMLRTGDLPGGVSYVAYVLVGSTMWGLFMAFYNGARNTLSAGQGLVLQVNYPHEVLLFQQAARRLAEFTIALALNVVVLVVLGEVPSWRAVLLPLVLVPTFLLASAIGLVLSMFAIVAVDLTRLVNSAMGVLMLLTPIVYSSSNPRHPLVLQVNKWNPLTYLICSARDIVLFGRLYDAQGFAICTAGALAAFLISWRLFFVSEHQIVERMI
jgi:lipopolysaccharide transport system permease protein